jgi:hypothetical protein
MLPIPDEYVETINNASIKLAELAKLVMFVAEMLENDTFELDTEDGFNIKITNSKDPQLIP